LQTLPEFALLLALPQSLAPLPPGPPGSATCSADAPAVHRKGNDEHRVAETDIEIDRQIDRCNGFTLKHLKQPLHVQKAIHIPQSTFQRFHAYKLAPNPNTHARTHARTHTHTHTHMRTRNTPGRPTMTGPARIAKLYHDDWTSKDSRIVPL
jgi:hypothetical protein